MRTRIALIVVLVLVVQPSCRRKEPEIQPKADVLQTPDLVTVKITAPPDARVQLQEYEHLQVVLEGRYADLQAKGPVEVNFKKADLKSFLDSFDSCELAPEVLSVSLTAAFTADTEKGRIVDHEPITLATRDLAKTALGIVDPPEGTEQTEPKIKMTLMSEIGARIEGEGLAQAVVVKDPTGKVEIEMDLGLEQGKVARKLSACASGKAKTSIAASYVRRLSPDQRYEAAKQSANDKLFYSSIKKNPDAWKGETILIGGPIFQIVGEKDGTGALLLKSGLSQVSVGHDLDLVMILYKYEGRESPFTEGSPDNLFFATVEGSYSYETKMGGSNTVPKLRALDYWHYSSGPEPKPKWTEEWFGPFRYFWMK